jgi:hypothetical protein
VLVIDEDASAVKCSDVLQARGWLSVTEASGSELALQACATQPDIILLSAVLWRSGHRQDAGFENRERTVSHECEGVCAAEDPDRG